MTGPFGGEGASIGDSSGHAKIKKQSMFGRAVKTRVVDIDGFHAALPRGQVESDVDLEKTHASTKPFLSALAGSFTDAGAETRQASGFFGAGRRSNDTPDATNSRQAILSKEVSEHTGKSSRAPGLIGELSQHNMAGHTGRDASIDKSAMERPSKKNDVPATGLESDAEDEEAKKP